jgi:hypothetical protein
MAVTAVTFRVRGLTRFLTSDAADSVQLAMCWCVDCQAVQRRDADGADVRAAHSTVSHAG